MAYNFQDELIKSQLYLERLKPQSLDILRSRINKAEAKISLAIISTQNLTEKARYAELRRVISEQLSIIYEPYTDLILEDMQRASELSYNATNKILNTVAALEATRTALAYKDLNQSAISRILDVNRPILGQTIGETKTFLTQSQTSRIKAAVINGLTDGVGLAKAQRNALAFENMQDTFSKIKRNDLATLTRTSMLQAINDARDESYNQHEDLIVGWTFLATLDSRTSFICASLDGTFYSSDKYSYNTIPKKPLLHYNCRSLLVPETRTSIKIEGRRPFTIQSSKTVNHRDNTSSTKFTVEKAGQVKGSTKFPEWFSRQSKTFQKDYLGPSRYTLYNENKLTFDLLVGAKNQPLTLDQLKDKLK